MRPPLFAKTVPAHGFGKRSWFVSRFSTRSQSVGSDTAEIAIRKELQSICSHSPSEANAQATNPRTVWRCTSEIKSLTYSHGMGQVTTLSKAAGLSGVTAPSSRCRLQKDEWLRTGSVLDASCTRSRHGGTVSAINFSSCVQRRHHFIEWAVARSERSQCPGICYR